MNGFRAVLGAIALSSVVGCASWGPTETGTALGAAAGGAAAGGFVGHEVGKRKESL